MASKTPPDSNTASQKGQTKPVEGGKKEGGSDKAGGKRQGSGRKQRACVENAESLALMLAGQPNFLEKTGFPGLDDEFGIVEDHKGTRRPIVIHTDGTVRYVVMEYVNAVLQKHIATKLAAKDPKFYNASADDAVKVGKLWFQMTDATPEAAITPVRAKNDPGLCYRRLDYDFDQDGPTPMWDNIMEATDSDDGRRIVESFIGSLFFKKADLSQYLCIHGRGGDGKSRITGFLKRTLGPAARATFMPKGDSARFFASTIQGSRLVILNEVERTKFVQTSVFKAITGGDTIPIEEKGKSVFEGTISAKFVFTTNETLEFGTKKADQRRALYVTMERDESEEDLPPSVVDERLDAEAPFIIHRCVERYKNDCDSFKPILPNVMLNEMATYETNEEMIDILKQYFEPCPFMFKWEEGTDGPDDPGHRFVRHTDFARALKHAYGREPNFKEKRLLAEIALVAFKTVDDQPRIKLEDETLEFRLTFGVRCNRFSRRLFDEDLEPWEQALVDGKATMKRRKPHLISNALKSRKGFGEKVKDKDPDGPVETPPRIH